MSKIASARNTMRLDQEVRLSELLVDATSTSWASPVQGMRREVDEPAPCKSGYRSFASG
jgi:hypothetical protein